jgi:NAD(P)H-hydrate epimerase
VAESFDVCLDGLFGMQFRPPFRAPADWLIELINEHPRIRLRAAVDVPSGIGDSSDAHPFRADFSYATGIAKAPLFAAENAQHVGRARYLDLGFFDAASSDLECGSLLPLSESGGKPPHSKGKATGSSASVVLTARVLDPLRALRDAHTDKRAFGHLFVVSGSRAMPGAVFMSVKSALLSGTGLVTAFVPETLATVFAAQLPEAMWVPMPETPSGGLALEGRGLIIARATRCSALLVGPGLGRDAESLTLVDELLRALDVPTVLDADALQRDVLAARARTATAPLVLTPHAGEFKRIADDAKLDVAARGLRATIVLKGAPTRICSGSAMLQPAPSGERGDEHERGLKHRATAEPVYFSPFGGPVLARGGSGDILAGMLAAQLAQGSSALEAAARAVVWHGRAADCLARAQGQASARVTELCDYFSAALAEDEFS